MRKRERERYLARHSGRASVAVALRGADCLDVVDDVGGGCLWLLFE